VAELTCTQRSHFHVGICSSHSWQLARSAGLTTQQLSHVHVSAVPHASSPAHGTH